MPNRKKRVSSLYLLQGAVYAFEQCGRLLSDARSLCLSGSYGSSIALTAFAREEMGRAMILLGLRAKVVAGKAVTAKEICEKCDDHVAKQKWATLSAGMILEKKKSVLADLLDARHQATPGSEEWRTADKAIRRFDKKKFSESPQKRHRQRMQALYVDPDDSGGWNRPLELSQSEACTLWTEALNDYRNGLQKVTPDLLGDDESDRLLKKELLEWADRLPMPVLSPIYLEELPTEADASPHQDL